MPVPTRAPASSRPTRSPFLHAFLVALPFVMAGAGCASPADEAQSESLRHLEAATRILAEHAGNSEAAGKALDAYLEQHRDAILQAKARGITALDAMPEKQREAFRKRSLERSQAVRERLNTLVRAFPEPAGIMQRLRQFQ